MGKAVKIKIREMQFFLFFFSSTAKISSIKVFRNSEKEVRFKIKTQVVLVGLELQDQRQMLNKLEQL